MIDITRFLVVIFLKSQDRRRVINTLNFFFLTPDRPLCAKYVAFVRCGTKGNTKHRRKKSGKTNHHDGCPSTEFQ